MIREYISSARILVVDDNPATLYSTSRVLQSAGWTVAGVTTGGEAVLQAANGFDLIILDVNLPDIDGFEVCRQIREVEATSQIPIVHLSASFLSDEAKIRGLDEGADGYLTHPVEPPVLIATVNAFLRTHHAEAESRRLLECERAARIEAERANRFKDEFLATLSHELRTPLHAIIGWAQLLKMDAIEAEERLSGLDVIERNAKAQAQMIADLLDVSRITSGKLHLEMQSVDPAAMTEAALTAIRPSATEKGVHLHKRIDAQIGQIQGDPARLQQVVWNLVNNAVKFTPAQGDVTVIVRRDDGVVEIAVVDNGAGIGSELLPHIFDRFLQGDASTTRLHGGLGLGLAIAKQLVEMHGGTVAAESDGIGKGATFRVRLPVESPAQSDRPPQLSVAVETVSARSDDQVNLSGVRILLVDDEADARSMLLRLLAKTGAQVVEASSVATALAAIDEAPPDLLLSDIGMPEQDGYDLLREVRARGLTFRDMPAIALTAFAAPADRRRTLLAGYQVHLAKPVDARELMATIATLLGRTGS